MGVLVRATWQVATCSSHGSSRVEAHDFWEYTQHDNGWGEGEGSNLRYSSGVGFMDRIHRNEKVDDDYLRYSYPLIWGIHST